MKYGYFAFLEKPETVNERIIAGFKAFEAEPLTRKSHFFEGRYENIYIETAKIPDLIPVIEQAIVYVAEILSQPADQLQCGFWFNSMQAGDVTIAHTHDDDDELMSGVYYLEVPENSGSLLLGVHDKQLIVEPEAGKMVFFRPNLIHQVTENLSGQQRLSIGMNFGLKKEFKSE